MKNIVLIDLETTGIDPNLDKIIEIAAVKVKDLRPAEKFHSLVNPERRLSPEITKITGIKDKDLTSAPTIKEVFPKLKKMIGENFVLAHNMDFDSAFLKKNGLDGSFLDSLNLSCMLFPIEKKHTQEHLLKKLCGVSYDAHRALEDVENLLILYKKLLERVAVMDERLKKDIKEALKDSNWAFKSLFESSGSGDDNYLSEKAEKTRFCPKDLPVNPGGVAMAHLLSWMFYTETGNLSEMSYWVRRKYEDFFREVRMKKCREGDCNYFNNNDRLF